MSAKGVLPPIDYAIHSDTGHERTQTYEFAERWTPWLEERGVKVVTVKAKNRLPVYVTNSGKPVTKMPMYVMGPLGPGMLWRKCTRDWKIDPINAYIRRHRKSKDEPIEQWLGITFDEFERVKPNRVKYITNRYPFLEMFDPPMKRWQVKQWLIDNDLEVPPKSSCIFCPYHTPVQWREVQADERDWKRALYIDEWIRYTRFAERHFIAYLWRDFEPLWKADFRTEEQKGQLSFMSELCEGGYCWA
jgi:hypothetical protein